MCLRISTDERMVLGGRYASIFLYAMKLFVFGGVDLTSQIVRLVTRFFDVVADTSMYRDKSFFGTPAIHFRLFLIRG
jgi:hypothetical protein